jgi:4-alpha-glucanotransferase
VGAPPDAFNQRGQDWRLPPLRPDRLTETGFAPLREMLVGVLVGAGGVRIDHVMGLFRLFWIPEGAEPTEGTYVGYPGQALLGVLALEAERAGAVVVGEDLGTVETGLREELRAAGVLGSSVVYFERDDEGEPVPPDDYPELALASVTTHDLPTAAGWWRDEALRLQAELGLLGEGRTLASELERAAAEREAMAALLRAEGLASVDADTPELVAAMHALLARTPSRLAAASPADAVGDLRQPNLPGTDEEYPNWRLPLAEPAGDGHRPIGLEELLAHPGTRRLAGILRRR